MLTHKQTPRQIAEEVLGKLQGGQFTRTQLVEFVVDGIEAYTDASNQRPENLSEACARLGINLHWVDGRNLAGRFEVYFGLGTPLSVHDTEAETIAQLEELSVLSNVAPVPTWVKAAG